MHNAKGRPEALPAALVQRRMLPYACVRACVSHRSACAQNHSKFRWNSTGRSGPLAVGWRLFGAAAVVVCVKSPCPPSTVPRNRFLTRAHTMHTPFCLRRIVSPDLDRADRADAAGAHKVFVYSNPRARAFMNERWRASAAAAAPKAPACGSRSIHDYAAATAAAVWCACRKRARASV